MLYDIITLALDGIVALALVTATVYLITRDILVRRENRRREADERARQGLPVRRMQGRRIR